MNEIVNAFFKISSEKFQFLVDEFAFRGGEKKSENGLYRVLYESDDTAVEISLEWKEQYVYVELFRLINGKIKENPIVIRPDSELTVHNLEDLIAIRAPKITLGTEYFCKPLTVKSLEHILSHYACVLKELGRDVLRGDFTVFSELESIVKERIAPVVSAEERNPTGGSSLMRVYEVLFTVAPNFEESDVDNLVTQLSNVATNQGAQIAKIDRMGRRRLAYPIGKFTEGYYVVLTLEGTGAEIAELERRMLVTDAVISFITIRIDEDTKQEAQHEAFWSLAGKMNL